MLFDTLLTLYTAPPDTYLTHIIMPLMTAGAWGGMGTVRLWGTTTCSWLFLNTIAFLIEVTT